jgi:hypothetical protein
MVLEVNEKILNGSGKNPPDKWGTQGAHLEEDRGI